MVLSLREEVVGRAIRLLSAPSAHGVTPADPATFAAVATLLTLVAWLASAVPA